MTRKTIHDIELTVERMEIVGPELFEVHASDRTNGKLASYVEIPAARVPMMVARAMADLVGVVAPLQTEHPEPTT